jgi:hypothetical protein
MLDRQILIAHEDGPTPTASSARESGTTAVQARTQPPLNHARQHTAVAGNRSPLPAERDLAEPSSVQTGPERRAASPDRSRNARDPAHWTGSDLRVWWWQVLGSNQRRLSRRFTGSRSQPIAIPTELRKLPSPPRQARPLSVWRPCLPSLPGQRSAGCGSCLTKSGWMPLNPILSAPSSRPPHPPDRFREPAQGSTQPAT